MTDEIDRKFSTGAEWDNSINWGDAPDGSEGGYDRHGNRIVPRAMTEIISLRVEVARLTAELARKDEALKSAEKLLVWGLDDTKSSLERQGAMVKSLAAIRAAKQNSSSRE